MTTFINIRLQGTVYFMARKNYKDNDVMQLFSSKLFRKSREAMFDALYSYFAGKWHHQHDIVYPFHGSQPIVDRRCVLLQTVWTFDLDSDLLRFDKLNLYSCVSLELLRETSVTPSDFKPYLPPTRPEHTLRTFFPPPYWKFSRRGLDLSLLQRRKAFISKMISDFAFQWRHVLHGPYNHDTFRRIAYAIIRFLTLDFTVVEVNYPRRGGKRGFLVQLQDLPQWDSSSESIIRVGGASIVMSQHIPHAVSLIREDFRKRNLLALHDGSFENSSSSNTYLIFSVQEIIVYRSNSERERYTTAYRLFDSPCTTSDAAINVLLEATQSRNPVIPVQSLALELQDMILKNTSASPIEQAKVGCRLNIGQVFNWKCGNRDIEKEESYRHRAAETSVESQIWFGNCFSGLSYT